jgi:hypothetical protein
VPLLDELHVNGRAEILPAHRLHAPAISIGRFVAVLPEHDTPGIEDLGEPRRKRVRRPRTLALMPSMCDRFSLPGVQLTLVRLYAPAYVTGRRTGQLGLASEA